MLKIGGCLNYLIAIGHIIGLFWAEKMFEVTGIGKEMEELALVHVSLPYLLTIFVTVVFFIFGLYAFSAEGKIKKLPFLKLAIFTIAGIYILRGAGELIFDMAIQEASPMAETVFSLIALGIGLLYLIGGLKKWEYIK